MSSNTRRAVYAARFLRPPGYMKRMSMREKPRDFTGPFENPVRKLVRLREKASQYCEMPPPRKVLRWYKICYYSTDQWGSFKTQQKLHFKVVFHAVH